MTHPPNQKAAGLETTGGYELTPTSYHNLAGWARSYAERGWSVFPVYGIRDGACTCRKGKDCGTPGKHPRVKGWQNTATTDPAQISDWWKKWPDANIGLLTGAASRLVVLDVDPRHDGDKSLAALEQKHGPLPQTLRAQTGGGGLHFFFAHPDDGHSVKNSQGQVGQGLDVKGDGGFVVAPPSLRLSGKRYAWATPDDAQDKPAGLPRWVLGAVMGGDFEIERSEENRESREIGSNNCSFLSPHSVLSISIPPIPAECLPVIPGQRSHRLFTFARWLKSLPQVASATKEQLRPIVRQWHQRVLAIIGTKPFEDTWVDFLYGWERVEQPFGHGLIDEALAVADTQEDPPEAADYDCPDTRRLVRWCRELQSRSGSGSFFLATGTVAQKLGMDPTTAWRRLKALVADGLLIVTETHTSKRATRYRYRGRGEPKIILTNKE